VLECYLCLKAHKTVCFSEQIMSADKYLSIFLCQMEAIVYLVLKSNGGYCVSYPLDIILNLQDLRIGEYHSDICQFQLGHIQSLSAVRPIGCE